MLTIENARALIKSVGWTYLIDLIICLSFECVELSKLCRHTHVHSPPFPQDKNNKGETPLLMSIELGLSFSPYSDPGTYSLRRVGCRLRAMGV